MVLADRSSQSAAQRQHASFDLLSKKNQFGSHHDSGKPGNTQDIQMTITSRSDYAAKFRQRSARNKLIFGLLSAVYLSAIFYAATRPQGLGTSQALALTIGMSAVLGACLWIGSLWSARRLRQWCARNNLTYMSFRGLPTWERPSSWSFATQEGEEVEAYELLVEDPRSPERIRSILIAWHNSFSPNPQVFDPVSKVATGIDGGSRS